MVNKKSLATFVRTIGNQVISGFKHFLNNVKVGGDLIINPNPIGTTTSTVLTVDGDGVVKTTTISGGSGTVTSVGLTMPSAFSVANSPITTSGTIAVTGAGTSAQYVRGDGQLANFPTTGGGGSTINYYLNGSVTQGTFGGNTYYELSKNPVTGAGTNFTRTAASGPGYIASFITDAGDPALLSIPGGNWNLEIYFSSSSSGGGPSFYGELYKVSASNVFTLIASNSLSPEGITNGTILDQYFTSIAVPQTTLLATDRLAVRIYVNPDGRNITIHTEDNNLCEVITTFSTGLNALNGLTSQVQYFATGTSGTDFNISSATDTHTFNLPTASSLNRGALSAANWTTFNNKADFSFKNIIVSGQAAIIADAADDTLTLASGSGITLTTNSSTDTLTITNSSPDQTVVLTSGSGISTSGTYPNFTITNNDRGSSQNIFKNIAVSGQSTIIADGNDDTLTVASGTGISLTTNATSDTLTITNTAPDQTVVLNAGTGISTSGTYPSFTVTNTAPDQTVALTAGSGISVSGTYPNFTISSSASGGTVTSIATTAPITGGTITTSGTIGITQSGASTSGFLSSTDWNTFNNKQNALTNPVTGTGTNNYVTKWTGTNTVNSSQIFDNGTNVGIGTASPSAKLHVVGNVTVSATLQTANAKITGTIADSSNQVGTAGQVLSSTGTGTQWITAGGGGGGTTITVKDEGTTVSSSISTLNFAGSNVNATASGSTATISVRDNVGTGSQYLNDLATTYVIPSSYTGTVQINGNDIIVVAPNASNTTETLIAVLTFGISNITGSDRFNSFYFRLYNNTTSSVISDTEHRWSSYMSVDDPTTIATFHIPIELTEINQGDDIYVQCQTSVVDAPEIYYCALTFIKGTE
jgi:hypothetical protein